MDIGQLERMKKGLSETELMQLEMQVRSERKEAGTLIALACLNAIGIAGIHRFMMGQTAMGILMLLTGGGCFIWTLFDIIGMNGKVARYNLDVEFRVTNEFLVRKRAREGTA